MLVIEMFNLHRATQGNFTWLKWEFKFFKAIFHNVIKCHSARKANICINVNREESSKEYQALCL